jgi:hypothetical protein
MEYQALYICGAGGFCGAGILGISGAGSEFFCKGIETKLTVVPILTDPAELTVVIWIDRI